MGCKSNQFEGQIVAQKLFEAGFVEVKNQKEADFYILNSCSVTQTSDNEAMYLLRHAHGLGLKTILTGCIAQIEKEKLLQDYKFASEDLQNKILQEILSVQKEIEKQPLVIRYNKIKKELKELVEPLNTNIIQKVYF